MGASLTRLPGFLRQESSFSGTCDMHVRLFRDLNLEERQRAKSATDLDSPFSVLEAAHPTTRDLNRYTDILPYKHSRIIINDAKDRNIKTSYINANRITAPALLRPSLPKDWPGFIATQAPLPHTQPRFWRMIEQQNVQVIVCLTAVNNDRTRRAQKAERYWPLVGQTDEFDGNLSVRNLGPMESGGDIEYHEFEMWNPQSGAETQRRRIMLVYYASWPDHGVPSTTEPLRDMLFRIRAWKAELRKKQQFCLGPTVVHCSAGCGRTGTFCVVDTILSVLEYTQYPNLARAFNAADSHQNIPEAAGEVAEASSSDMYNWQGERDIILEALAAFRLERMLMVQTVDQFSFCYKAVRDLCS
ncbi:tyrosine protein phosphatase 1 [Mortierella alpina]|uniref:Tyrosine protein phosphatase 1 n=1 Tax=Mortierella alpina TaxID=64518 RepID=A0A9P6M6V8_MORAP|nr:tyrosine protein phosphatase 1 [Mortierella alpina]